MSYSYWYNTDYEPLYEGQADTIEGFWGIDTSNIFEALAEYGTPCHFSRVHASQRVAARRS